MTFYFVLIIYIMTCFASTQRPLILIKRHLVQWKKKERKILRWCRWSYSPWYEQKVNEEEREQERHWIEACPQTVRCGRFKAMDGHSTKYICVPHVFVFTGKHLLVQQKKIINQAANIQPSGKYYNVYNAFNHLRFNYIALACICVYGDYCVCLLHVCKTLNAQKWNQAWCVHCVDAYRFSFMLSWSPQFAKIVISISVIWLGNWAYAPQPTVQYCTTCVCVCVA